MDNHEIARQIDELVAEEHRLTQAHIGVGLSDEERRQLDRIEVQLDQCWDLLRQRRAAREFGGDPDSAEVRPASTVEGYKQ
ncbi:MAG: DUF2630 family protein [Acidimicrobiales bacterium]